MRPFFFFVFCGIRGPCNPLPSCGRLPGRPLQAWGTFMRRSGPVILRKAREVWKPKKYLFQSCGRPVLNQKVLVCVICTWERCLWGHPGGKNAHFLLFQTLHASSPTARMPTFAYTGPEGAGLQFRVSGIERLKQSRAIEGAYSNTYSN